MVCRTTDDSMSCHICQSEAVARCYNCGELVCAEHNKGEVCPRCSTGYAAGDPRGSPISVFSQDKDLRFTWAHNAPAGLSPEFLKGKTDAEVLPADAAERIMAAKRKAMETGEAQQLEANFELFGRKRSFYLLIEALRDERNAVLGTTSVAVDISERKANEDQLRLLLRELTHRSKNLLAVIHAIARQTASRTRSVSRPMRRGWISGMRRNISSKWLVCMAAMRVGAVARMVEGNCVMREYGNIPVTLPALAI